jgi:riboflavin kinase/FMN adenylyltransferase
LGYPTANLRIQDKYKIIPAFGVYVVKAIHNNQEFAGMMNIGINPTTENFGLHIEVNIFDFDQEIYGDMLTVKILARLRNEKKFASLEELKLAIAADKIASLKFLRNL